MQTFFLKSVLTVIQFCSVTDDDSYTKAWKFCFLHFLIQLSDPTFINFYMAIVSHTTTAFLKHCCVITFLFHYSLFLFYITLTFSSSVLRFLLFCFSWCSGHRVKTYVLPPSSHSVILTMKELERIKRESLIKSEILSVEEKKKENINRVERDFIANERKSKMRSLEAESLLRDERTDVDAETRGNDQLRRDVTMETVRTWVRTHVRTWTCC